MNWWGFTTRKRRKPILIALICQSRAQRFRMRKSLCNTLEVSRSKSWEWRFANDLHIVVRLGLYKVPHHYKKVVGCPTIARKEDSNDSHGLIYG